MRAQNAILSHLKLQRGSPPGWMGLEESGCMEKPTILAVDDMPYMRSFYFQALRGLPVRFHFAGDGKEAIEIAGRVKPTLVFLDYMMPQMNGSAVMERLRAMPGLEKTLFVLVTAMGEQEARSVTGFDRILFKPVRYQALLDAVTELTDIRPEENSTVTG